MPHQKGRNKIIQDADSPFGEKHYLARQSRFSSTPKLFREVKERNATQANCLNKLAETVEIYQKLVAENAAESSFQKFFEKNPIVIEPRVQHVFSKMSFGGENFPDFLFALNDSRYLIIEIEKPEARLFTKRGDPTAKLTHAQHQIRSYLEWASEERDYLRRRGCPNINPSNTRGLIIIGKSYTLGRMEKRVLESINAETQSKYEIKTFDRIADDFKAILNNFLKA
jgi:hypothetical protein